MPEQARIRSVRNFKTGWRRGWERGYRLGTEYGYHFGRCEAVLRGVPNPSPGWWDIRLLYITSGKDVPYSELDQSIIRALRPLVRELIVQAPSQPYTEEALRQRPDLVLVLDGMYVKADKVQKMRSAGIRTAIWLPDDPYYTDLTVKMARNYDVVFTLELECVELYRQNGCMNVHYMPFAADPGIFRPLSVPVRYRRDVSFIGSAYWNRVDFFNRVAPYLANKETFISGLWWKRLKNYRGLARKIQFGKWLGPLETASYYNGSKIVINMHRATEDRSFNQNSRRIKAVSPNPRTFEIAGCGTLQLTDVRSDLARFYAPGTEIVTYSSPGELMDKIEYYLTHEEERREVALNALRRTMQEHTYPHRMGQMLKLLFG